MEVETHQDLLEVEVRLVLEEARLHNSNLIIEQEDQVLHLLFQ